MAIVIEPHDPRSAAVRVLLEAHLEFARATTPPEHIHALNIEGLLDPAVSFFGARVDGSLLGIGALKELDPTWGELKSMHTLQMVRGRGVGRAMVDHLLGVARERRYQRVSLETGTMRDFDPARRLYERVGFTPCPPFAQYTVNPYSLCMSMELDG
jgi:putative acetyltransferase